MTRMSSKTARRKNINSANMTRGSANTEGKMTDIGFMLGDINLAPKPDIPEPPICELKPLPTHLQYVLLGRNDSYPVIVSSLLTLTEKERLLRVLRENKASIR